MRNAIVVVGILVVSGAALADKAKKPTKPPPPPKEIVLVECRDANTFNYGTLRVVETKAGIRIHITATQVFSAHERKDLHSGSDVTVTFAADECRRSAEHPTLFRCHRSGETPFQAGRDKLTASWFHVHTERVSRRAVDGETETVEAYVRLGHDPKNDRAGTVGAEGMIPFEPSECGPQPSAPPTP